MTIDITTSNAEETKSVARRLSGCLTGGEVIVLLSDLGGGKTTFTQGLMLGLGYTGPVTSPTFTLSNIYPLSGGLFVHHYDLYRLSEGGVVASELAEDIALPNIITVIEWPAAAEQVLPADRLNIVFEPISDTGRKLQLTGSGPISNRLVNELKA